MRLPASLLLPFLLSYLLIVDCFAQTAQNIDTDYMINYMDSNNQKQGKWEYYYRDGSLRMVLLYKNNLPWEALLSFSLEGKALDPGTLKNGDGILKLYYDNGVLQYEITYEDGYINGMFREYYPTGQLYAEGLLIEMPQSNSKGSNYHAYKEGTWRYYSKIGFVYKIAVYNNGTLIRASSR